MQIAFILTAFHFQSLISAPALTSLSSVLSPPLLSLSSSSPSIAFFLSFMLFFSISFPIYPHSFTQIAFHLLIPIAPTPHLSSAFAAYLPIMISEELLHLFASSGLKKKKKMRKHIGGECEWLRSLLLNRPSRGSCLENVAGVGSLSEVLHGFWRAL